MPVFLSSMNLQRQAAWVNIPAKEWIACARKQLILTPEGAQYRAVHMQMKYKEVFTWYQCRYCGGYHVGRIGQKSEKRILQNRIKNLRNAIRYLTPVWLEKWSKVI